MLIGTSAYSGRVRFLAMMVLWSSCLVPSLFASVWSCAVGDARAVRRKTEDVSERLNEKFPFSIACHPAAQLDNAACQLVDSVSRGAPWHQVQSSLQRTCALAGQVNALVNADCNVRNDRRTRDHLNELSRRLERLRCNLDKAYAKTQPVFCEPPRARRQVPGIILRSHGSLHEPFAPSPFPSTYDFESLPESRSYEFQNPNAFPEDREIGPIQYRDDRNEMARPSRGQIFARIGMEVLRAVAD